MFIAILCLFLLPIQFIKQKTTAPPLLEKECPVEIQVEGFPEPLSLEDYIVGVVSAEMPSSFHEEALKAQAIAARTFALKLTNYGELPIKPTVSHQAFVSNEKQKYNENIKKAVAETASQVLSYKDELITAMFFSTSNGLTESAKGYSGFDIPYLVSTESSGDEQSPKFLQQKKFTLDEWNEAFGITWTSELLESIQLYPNTSKRIQTMKAKNYSWTGREIREILDLPSTDFLIEIKGQQITVNTKGYGHGVGLSQYGANALANEGKLAKDILLHYYQNTEIKNFETLNPLCLKP